MHAKGWVGEAWVHVCVWVGWCAGGYMHGHMHMSSTVWSQFGPWLPSPDPVFLPSLRGCAARGLLNTNHATWITVGRNSFLLMKPHEVYVLRLSNAVP